MAERSLEVLNADTVCSHNVESLRLTNTLEKPNDKCWWQGMKLSVVLVHETDIKRKDEFVNEDVSEV